MNWLKESWWSLVHYWRCSRWLRAERRWDGWCFGLEYEEKNRLRDLCNDSMKELKKIWNGKGE